MSVPSGTIQTFAMVGIREQLSDTISNIDPYETPDFIFLGDDTSSAAGAFALTSVVLIRPPVLAMGADGRVAWPGLAGVEYTVEASANLVTWQTVGTARAVDGVCQFDAANLAQPAFIRVVGP